MIKAVIFDRDGVLTRFNLQAAAAYFQPRIPLPLDAIRERWLAQGHTRGFPRSLDEEQRFWAAFWHDLGREFTLSATVQRELDQFKYTSLIELFDDAPGALGLARERGMRTGVLSNFSLASLEDSLAAVGLLDLVDVACATQRIGVAKPNAAAYQHIANDLGIDPTECLMFDDEPPCVDGARAVGMQAYLVDRRQKAHHIGDGIVADLSALAQILDSRVGGIHHGG
jgi:putative hydrolase of the HAD superfamily